MEDTDLVPGLQNLSEAQLVHVMQAAAQGNPSVLTAAGRFVSNAKLQRQSETYEAVLFETEGIMLVTQAGSEHDQQAQLLGVEMVEIRSVATFERRLEGYDVSLDITLHMDEGGRYDQPENINASWRQHVGKLLLMASWQAENHERTLHRYIDIGKILKWDEDEVLDTLRRAYSLHLQSGGMIDERGTQSESLLSADAWQHVQQELMIEEALASDDE